MENKEKTIGFDHESVPSIRDGTKLFTFRFGDKYDFLEVGDVVSLNDSETHEVFGLAEIMSKERVAFGDLPIDLSGHEQFSTKEEQRKALKKYTSRTIKDDSEGLLIGYKLIEKYE